MSLFSDLGMYGRFAFGLRSFLNHTITLEEARSTIRKRMEEREANFLRLVERGIFGYARSPYLPLLKLAHCELGDIRNMVRAKGLESTLLALREAGVYVTFEEFKGRKAIVRHGQTIRVRPQDFDNPHLGRYYYQAETGGSTGIGTRVAIDLQHVAAQAPVIMLECDAYGVLTAPTIIWRGLLPDQTGIFNILYSAKIGNIPIKWFSPVTKGDLGSSIKNRLATRYFVILGRLAGKPIPRPEVVPLDQAARIAYEIAVILKERGSCLIRAIVSMALRICIAARENGLDLTGATFIGGGEPPTAGKVREITRTGARYFPVYFFTEFGAIGLGCVQPSDANDLHFLKDGLALIQHPRRAPGTEITVDAFHFTTLLPTAPKLMLNVESDDYGVIEKRSCGCPFEGYVFDDHLRHVRSFRKLTGEGVTLIGSEMLHILHEVLPNRFGGTSLDYQLLEEEDNHGFTRLFLLISPRVGSINEQAVVETVLEALSRGSDAGSVAGAIWRQAGTLKVRRTEPIWTARGKLMPLHLSHRSKG